MAAAGGRRPGAAGRGNVPPGVDDPAIASRARSGDLIAPEGQHWLGAYEETMGQALHSVLALAAE